MTKEEAKVIANKEDLKINWFGEHKLGQNEMVIQEKDGRYQVFGTDEKANLWGVITEYGTEEEALSNLIKKARL